MKSPLVLAITGASGAVYAARLLQQLILADQAVHLVVSPSSLDVLKLELKVESSHMEVDAMRLLTFHMDQPAGRWLPMTLDRACEAINSQLVVHAYRDFLAPIASGSFLTRGMIICPCSGSTLSGVVHATGDNLIQRAADVHLKEHRKLIVVPRETPLSVFQLENMYRAAQAGAIVLPAMPGWYHGVESLVDLVDFVVARIMDHLDVEHRLMSRWGDKELP